MIYGRKTNESVNNERKYRKMETKLKLTRAKRTVSNGINVKYMTQKMLKNKAISFGRKIK